MCCTVGYKQIGAVKITKICRYLLLNLCNELESAIKYHVEILTC